jgi:hypothetical protein
MPQAWIDLIKEWQPWLLPTLLSGLINTVVSSRKLYLDAKSPFFRPFRIPGFYLWLLVQNSIPACFFWFYSKASTKPPVNSEFYLSAITIGFFFTLVVNSNSDIGFVSFSIDKFYGFLNKFTYDIISSNQTRKYTDFKRSLKAHLSNQARFIEPSLDYLKDYVEDDISFKYDEELRSDYLKKIKTAEQEPDQAIKIATTIALAKLILPRGAYPRWLKETGCDQTLINSLK